MKTDIPVAPSRFVLLDGMRGFAALGVVAFHVARDGTPYWHIDSFYLFVDFFFVLSGFVLQPSMPRDFTSYWRQCATFLAKRILRLWPMLIASVGLSALLYYAQMAIVHSRGDGFNYDLTRTPENYFAALTLLQIWIPASMMMVVPLWSLSAEWFSNLIFAFLTPIKWMIGSLAGITAGYWLLHHGLTTDTSWISWIGPIRGEEALGRALIGLGIGVLGRMLFNLISAKPKMRRWLLNVPWLIASFFAARWMFEENKDLGYDVLYFAGPVFGILVIQAGNISLTKQSLAGRFLSKIGAWSFGVYALHRSVMDAFNAWSAQSGRWYSTPVYMAPDSAWHTYIWLKGCVVTIICIALTEIICRSFERPLQSRGKTWLSRYEQRPVRSTS